MDAAVRERERELLRQIGGLADRVRALRTADAIANREQIQALTADMRTLWGEIRVLRAPPVVEDVRRPSPEPRARKTTATAGATDKTLADVIQRMRSNR